MLKKQVKNRKKKMDVRHVSSVNKLSKQLVKKGRDEKEIRILKNNHYGSTLSLLSCHNVSQCSLLGESRNSLLKKGKSKNRESSISIVYKDDKDGGVKEKQKSKVVKDVKKSKKNSSLNQNSKSRKQMIGLSVQKGRQYKKSKIVKQQFYERINIGLYKSKTNSQINFSNNSSVRQNENESKLKKYLTIDCSDEYILNQHFNNSRIRNNQKRRYDAAVMIQKIVRGYLTRKVLGEFIEKEEVKLYEMSMRMRNLSSGRSGGQGGSIQNLSLRNRMLSDRNNENKTEKMKRLERVKLSEDIFLRDSQQSSHKKNLSSKRKNLDIEEIQISLKNSRNELLGVMYNGSLEQQSSIYGQQHDILSQYIPFDEKYMVNESDNFSICQTRIKGGDKYGDGGNDGDERSGQIGRQRDDKYMNGQYFKQTPVLSWDTSKCKVDDPIATDFSQKRVHEFDDEYENRQKQFNGDGDGRNRKIKNFMNCNEVIFENERLSDFSKKNSVEYKNMKNLGKDQEKKGNTNVSKQKQMINILRREEKQKWGQIIEMLSHEIVQQKVKNKDNERFMKIILEFSKRNKQELENTCLFESELGEGIKLPMAYQVQQQRSPELKVNRQNRKDFLLIGKAQRANLSEFQQQKQVNLNVTRQQIQEQNRKLNKNQEMPLVCKRVNCHTPRENVNGKIGILQKTQQLKSFYIRNYGSYPIQEMIEIRQKVLSMKQKQMMDRLNEDLHYNRISHDRFIQCLCEMQEKVENERGLISKAKMEIYSGYRASHKLMQDCFKDAWYLGLKIPFSQSLKDFKGSSNSLWVKDIIVDELKSFNLGSVKKCDGKQQVSNDKENESYGEEKESYEYENDGNGEHDGDVLMKGVLHENRKGVGLLYDQQESLLSRQDVKSNDYSQQSLYSQEISYNEGQIQINSLQQKNGYILDDDINNEYENSFEVRDQNVYKFKKLDGNKIVQKINQGCNYEECPLLLDPEEQEENENQVLRKISINQRKRTVHEEQGRFDIEIGNKNLQMKPKSEVYKVELSSSQEQDENNEELDPQIKEIIEGQIEYLLWEIVSQVYVNVHMRNKMCKGRNKMPTRVSVEQQMGFIKCLDEKIPGFEILKPKINQKMTASRIELLKFMRVNFDEDESDGMVEVDEGCFDGSSSNSDVFEEIGKFQHILSSDLCTQTLNVFLRREEQKSKGNVNELVDGISQQLKKKLGQKVSSECYKKVLERERILKHNENQRDDLRRQIKKIQFHCIFDAFNEIIMKRRLKFNGYSGIGLNELSLVTYRQSLKEIDDERQFDELMVGARKQLVELVGGDKSSGEKLLMQNYERLCQNDSQWIYYTQEALSFALEFVYMLEDEIFFEEAALIFRARRKC